MGKGDERVASAQTGCPSPTYPNLSRPSQSFPILPTPSPSSFRSPFGRLPPMPPVHVTSEIGALRAVLVHEPGAELEAVTPDTRGHYLYDDIIDLRFAQAEHRQLTQLLRRFTDVYEVRQLLVEVVENPEARDILISRTMDMVPSRPLGERMADLSAQDLVTTLVEGTLEEGGPLARQLHDVGHALPPVPNLFFTRDIGIVIGDHVVIGSMRHGARWSEELLVKVLFRYHPLLQNAGILYDGSEERRLTYSLEGGDVHPLREDLLLLGHSARTSAAAIDHLCEALFEHTPVTDIVVVVMPSEPAAIHLDMIFTQLDREVCVVFPPHFLGPTRLGVLHRRKGSASLSEAPDFFSALRSVDFELEPVFCGGEDRAVQEREQWGSGCNLVALRPGLGVAYRRNEVTLAELAKHGFTVMDADDLLEGRAELAPDDRAVVTIGGAELVRGGGGPRCMTLPLLREPL